MSPLTILEYNWSISMNTKLRLSALIYAVAFVGGFAGCVNTIPENISVTSAPTVVLRELQSITTSPPKKTSTFVVPTLPVLDPTATPYTYTIKSGDTLIAIASEKGVTVEQIQMANSGVDPLSLQPGQDLVIPFGDIVLANDNTSDIEYKLLEIKQFQCFPSPTEGQLCLGELENKTANPVINLVVQVTAILANGEIGPSKATFAPLEIIMPGKSTPISVHFLTNEEVWGAAGKVFKAEDGTALSNRFVVLNSTITSTQQSVSSKHTVTAEIHNPSDKSVDSIDILITAYNISNQIQSYRIIEHQQTMAPEQKSDVDIILTIASEQFSHYSIYAHGRSISE